MMTVSDRVAELERLYQESQAALAAADRGRAEAEAVLRSHEVIAGILAHDLKNPLAAVLMNARLLRDAEPDRTRGIGRRILTSGERMARMIEQILEWSRVRSAAGFITLERAACDLAPIVHEVVTDLRARKPEAQIAIEANGDLTGAWDADRLAFVVSNLVGNALEHASRPGVAVVLDGASAEVRLSVTNEGRVDDQILPTLFEPFHGRERGSRARGRGLGLGLYLTREIVSAHGGRVELDGAAAERVRFVVTLPRAAAAGAR